MWLPLCFFKNWFGGGGEREREREREINLFPLMFSLVDSSMCPDGRLNLQPRHIRMTLQQTELPGQGSFCLFASPEDIFIDFGERMKRERNTNQLPPVWAPTRDWIHNPDMCPDQELNTNFRCVGPCSNHLSRPARALYAFLMTAYLSFSRTVPKYLSVSLCPNE